MRGVARSGLGRILLADSDIGIQATLAVTLGGRFLVTDCCNVADAMDLLATAPPSMVILSVRQPDLDPRDLMCAVRAQVPRCPVLLVTDAAHAELARTLMTHGINGYFLKPLRFDRLLERIAELLGAPPHRAFHLSSPVSAVIQHLSGQHARMPTVKELAQLAGMSVGHFSHTFSLETGMPPKEYLTRLRVELAKRMLHRTGGKLGTIASTLGFWDASHLSRVFRARAGEPPGHFRKRLSRAG
jgi:AraC-like DNA-binding protein